MGLFDKLDTEKVEVGADSVGGMSFEPIRRTGVYPFKIKTAYAIVSKGGALGVKLEMIGSDGSLNTTEYVTSGEQKGCKPTFQYAKYLKLHYLITGKKVENLHTEKRPVMVWDNDANGVGKGAMVEKEMDVFVDWIGKDIQAACERVLEDKFGASGEIKDTVSVRSFLTAGSGRSYTEALEGADESKYLADFKAKRDSEYFMDKREDTKSLPVPEILTLAQIKAKKEAEKGGEAFGSGTDTPEIDINEDEIPF